MYAYFDFGLSELLYFGMVSLLRGIAKEDCRTVQVGIDLHK